MAKKIVVLGAGLAGLSAAFFLSKKGFDVTVLEKENFVGGLAATIKKKGYLLDFGPHPFYTEKKPVLDLFKRIVGKNNIHTFERDCLLFFDNRYLNYPLTLKNALFQMGLKTTILAPVSYIKTRISRAFSKKHKSSFEEWARSSFGDYLFEIFFKPYTEKFWGLKCSQLDASWADARVSKVSFIRTIISLLHKPAKVESSLERDTLPIYYPKKGIGKLADNLAKEIKKHGSRVLLKQEISAILEKTSGFEIVSNGKKFFADNIVSTIPLFDFVPLLSTKKPEEITAALGQLKKRALLIGYFSTKKQDILKSSYIYFVGRPYHRITEIGKFSKHLCPKGKNMLSFEISCFEGDVYWNMPEKKLSRLCLSALEKDGFLEEKDIENFFLLKARAAYPVYAVNYKKNLDPVLSFLKSIPGVYFLGRQGEYNYKDMDEVILNGKRIAEEIEKSIGY